MPRGTLSRDPVATEADRFIQSIPIPIPIPTPTPIPTPIPIPIPIPNPIPEKTRRGRVGRDPVMVRRLVAGLLDLVFAPACAACDALVAEPLPFCTACAASIDPAPARPGAAAAPYLYGGEL
ncbi:MAG TPA: double zinc ribbon domain-containing protein, partial [Gaiellaceae bacterium]|nr:double zinc ribbon domain-containing protein [Gaiellaceae bacterium]